MNKILKFLICYDLLTLSSFGLVQPIFALFLEQEITGVTTATIGIAAAIFLAVKSLIQPLIGRIADNEKGNQREVKFLYVSSILIIVTPLIYIFAKNIYHIYIAQFIYGVGMAFSSAVWYTLYTRFVDDNKAGFQWSMYDTITGLAGAATAFIGAVIAQYFGFKSVFILISVFSCFSLFVMIFLERHAIKNYSKK